MTTSAKPRRAALSASRLGDFQQCPLLFRFNVVDAIKTPPTPVQERGTLVHSVLEILYDSPAPERTPKLAQELVTQLWDDKLEKQPEVQELFATEDEVSAWLHQVRDLVSQYFSLENPARLQPAARERYVRTTIGGGLAVHGFIDRVDVAPNGAVRVVDYKTGKAPALRFQSKALFQLRFYALLLAHHDGQLPARLQLVYLGNGQILTMDPTPDQIDATEDEVRALWARIKQTALTGDFQPRRSALCSWCAHQSICPLFAGTPPQLPAAGIERLLTVEEGAATTD